MRDLAEVAMDGGTVRPLARGEKRERTVTVNRAESPLAWLAARRLVSLRQNEAGERLRADYERAQLAASVTIRWRPRVDGSGGPANHHDRTIAAKRRFDAAIAAVGPGLADLLWRTVCAGEAMPASEKALGWPARSGRVVLGLALDRLADHYRLP